jgi:hypothetical protein
MKVPSATSTGAGAAVIAVLSALALSSPVQGREISGTLSAPGYRVVAVAPSGRITEAPRGRRFSLAPPARTVRLQLLGRDGRYFGPVVVRRRGGMLLTQVRNGARLGRITILGGRGFARTERPLPRRWLGRGQGAVARNGAPLGAGNFGRVRSPARSAGRAGTDADRDGIPGLLDVDDDGDLRPDAAERAGGRIAAPAALSAALPGLAATCPRTVCSGRLGARVSDVEDVDVALAIAVLAALLAATSLGWQIASALRGRKRGVHVEVRLGLPVYQQGGGQWAVFIEVRNSTGYPVRWISATLETADERSLYLMQFPPGGELPAVIAPGDSHHTWVGVIELERSGLDLRTPVAAEVKLDSGALIRSRQRRLVSRSFGERLRGQR